MVGENGCGLPLFWHGRRTAIAAAILAETGCPHPRQFHQEASGGEVRFRGCRTGTADKRHDPVCDRCRVAKTASCTCCTESEKTRLYHHLRPLAAKPGSGDERRPAFDRAAR